MMLIAAGLNMWPYYLSVFTVQHC